MGSSRPSCSLPYHKAFSINTEVGTKEEKKERPEEASVFHFYEMYCLSYMIFKIIKKKTQLEFHISFKTSELLRDEMCSNDTWKLINKFLFNENNKTSKI